MNNQGWFIGPNDELLSWVPPYLRPCSLTTGVKFVIRRGPSSHWLSVDHVMHGQDWQKILKG